MLVTANRLRQVRDAVPPQQYLLPTECEFYQAYNWCLNPFPTVFEAIDHLRGEIDRLKVGRMTGRPARSRQIYFYCPAPCQPHIALPRPISIVSVRPSSSDARSFDILTSGACSRSHGRLCIRTVGHVNAARRVKPCGPAARPCFWSYCKPQTRAGPEICAAA